MKMRNCGFIGALSCLALSSFFLSFDASAQEQQGSSPRRQSNPARMTTVKDIVDEHPDDFVIRIKDKEKKEPRQQVPPNSIKEEAAVEQAPDPSHAPSFMQAVTAVYASTVTWVKEKCAKTPSPAQKPTPTPCK